MAKGLQVAQVALAPGGLQDSRAVPQPGDMRTLEHFVNFRGRWAVRPPITQLVQLLDDQATRQPVDQVLAVADFDGHWFVITHGGAGGAKKTFVHKLNKDTLAEVAPFNPGVVWTGTTVPIVVLTPMAGGAADIVQAEDRLYITDYLQNSAHPTKFIRTSDDTIQTLSLALDGTTTLRNVFFSTMLEYQFHLWGAGFLENDGTNVILRPELIRFSQPGLIPGADPDVATLTAEWWFNDHRGVARREDKITALSKAGGAMIAGKRQELYVVSGFDRNSWALEQVSNRIGIVGPYAADFTPEGVCYFWSETGPARTDGRGVDTAFAEDIRQRINSSIVDQTQSVAVSVDDGLVYFSRPVPGDSAPKQWLTFDFKRDRWSDGFWLKGATTRIAINLMQAVTKSTLAAPQGAPSGLVAVTDDQDKITLSWTNGDTALGTVTEIEGSVNNVAAGCAGAFVKLGEVSSGSTTFQATGLTSKRFHCFRVRHVRNGQNSAYSNTVSDRQTELADPTDLACETLATGVRLRFTNNESLAEIRIERRNLTQGGGFEPVTTLLDQATGEIVYDDTTAACGDSHEYRVRAEEAGWTSSGFSNTCSQTACQSPPNLLSVAHTVALTVNCPFDPNVSITYRASNVQPEDTRKIYRNVNGGGFSLISSHAPLQSLESFNHLWGRKQGAGSETFQVRVEVYEGGITLVETLDSTLSNESTNATICPE